MHVSTFTIFFDLSTTSIILPNTPFTHCAQLQASARQTATQQVKRQCLSNWSWWAVWVNSFIMFMHGNRGLFDAVGWLKLIKKGLMIIAICQGLLNDHKNTPNYAFSRAGPSKTPLFLWFHGPVSRIKFTPYTRVLGNAGAGTFCHEWGDRAWAS